MVKVLVCGGRDYRDVVCVFKTLEAIHAKTPIGVIIEGGALGADELAEVWAADRGVRCWAFPALWKLNGKAAGPIRNQRMIDEGKPDLVVAFPGGRGTADMVRRARTAGVEVIEVQSA